MEVKKDEGKRVALKWVIDWASPERQLQPTELLKRSPPTVTTRVFEMRVGFGQHCSADNQQNRGKFYHDLQILQGLHKNSAVSDCIYNSDNLLKQGDCILHNLPGELPRTS
jgi:hypothetical protein